MKVTKEQLVQLEELRCGELKQKIQLTKDDRTYFYKIGEIFGYDDPCDFCIDYLDIGKIKFLIDYLETVKTINSEVKKFKGWTYYEPDNGGVLVCSIDFENKIYIGIDGIKHIESAISAYKEVIEERNMVEVPKNLEHLVDMLGAVEECREILKPKKSFNLTKSDKQAIVDNFPEICMAFGVDI